MVRNLFLEDLLGSSATKRILAELEAAPGAAAGVYGRDANARVEPFVRSAQLLEVSASLRDEVHRLFAGLQEKLAAHFAVTLSGFEEPKFLRYGPGDFFVAHQDGNTPVIRDDSRHRRVSAVVFLNSDYEGGALVLHGAYPNLTERHVVPAAPGSLVAFPSETTHEVTPVASGQRYTIVSWYRQ